MTDLERWNTHCLHWIDGNECCCNCHAEFPSVEASWARDCPGEPKTATDGSAQGGAA